MCLMVWLTKLSFLNAERLFSTSLPLCYMSIVQTRRGNTEYDKFTKITYQIEFWVRASQTSIRLSLVLGLASCSVFEDAIQQVFSSQTCTVWQSLGMLVRFSALKKILKFAFILNEKYIHSSEFSCKHGFCFYLVWERGSVSFHS